MKRCLKGIVLSCLLLILATAWGAKEAQAAIVDNPGDLSITVSYTAGFIDTTDDTVLVDKGEHGVKTGDNSQMESWFILLIASALFIALMLIIKEKQEREDNRF